MRGDLVHAIEHQIMLHDHQPECVSPIPCIVLDYTMSIHFDPEIEDDEYPSKDPAKDMGDGRVASRGMEVCPSEAGIRDKVADRALRQFTHERAGRAQV